ncbi:MAG TPA: multiubiquitin domain-containing protein [Gammaproteobacteria bacterium]|nr:multiubiquitin domain-containing protein [Gammaproteobacteria bacterium]
MEHRTERQEHGGKGHHGHPHDDKKVTIIVNGREEEVPKNDPLTFNELIALAYNNPPTGEFIYWTITYRKGHGDKPEGTLTEGGSVKPKEGMVFNVTYTDKS